MMFRIETHSETDNGSGDRADDQGRQLVKIRGAVFLVRAACLTAAT